MIIRKCKISDIDQLYALDRILEIHPWNRRSKKNWHWKYFGKNPAGKSIFFVAELKSKLIASFAAIPINYNIKKKKILTCHSIAMMVHPDWQNKGLIKFVADKVFNEIRKKKLPFVYGYPNDRAYNLHKNIFGYEDVFDQVTYGVSAKRYNYFNFKYLNNNSSLKVRVVHNFGKAFDAFFNLEKKKFKVSVEKSRKFLNWRYASRPDHKYFCYSVLDNNNNLKGYFILKQYNKDKSLKSHIVDYFYSEKDKKNICNFIMYKSCQIAFKKFKAKELTLWCNADSYMQKITKVSNFSKISSRKMICKIFNQKYRKILKKNNWFFTMGDTLEIY